MVLDASGSVLYQSDYYPFGGTAYTSGSTSNPYGFTGYEADTETSSNYAIYRNQAPILGRFLRPDPSDGSYHLGNPQSLNRYSYVGNKPLMHTDRFGLDDDGDEDSGGDGSDGGNDGACSAACGDIPDIDHDDDDPDYSASVSADADDDELGVEGGMVEGTVTGSDGNGKSQQRQNCEANAQQQLDNTMNNLQQNFWSNVGHSAVRGGAEGAVAGCIFGAAGATVTIVGAPAAWAACLGGAGIGGIDGMGLGAADSMWNSISAVLDAKSQYQKQMQSCAAQ